MSGDVWDGLDEGERHERAIAKEQTRREAEARRLQRTQSGDCDGTEDYEAIARREIAQSRRRGRA